MVWVNIPDVRQGVRFALEHTLPLGFKVEAVVVTMIPENNIVVPSGLVSNGKVVGIVFVARYHRIGVSKAFVSQFRSSLPLIGVKAILWVINVYTVWCIAEWRWWTWSSHHGALTQNSYGWCVRNGSRTLCGSRDLIWKIAWLLGDAEMWRQSSQLDWKRMLNSMCWTRPHMIVLCAPCPHVMYYTSGQTVLPKNLDRGSYVEFYTQNISKELLLEKKHH